MKVSVRGIFGQREVSIRKSSRSREVSEGKNMCDVRLKRKKL